MTDGIGSFIALMCGLVLLRLRIDGEHTLYVKPSMGRWLVVAGCLLVLLGTSGLLRWVISGTGGRSAARAGGDDESHPTHDDVDHGHDHSRTPRVALLLIVPVVAVFTLEPAPLGSFAASRGSGNQRLVANAPRSPADLPPMTIPQATAFNTGTVPPGSAPDAAPPLFSPLPAPRDGAIDLLLSDYVTRALYDPVRALGDAPIRLVGFVAPRPGGGGFRLTRFSIACCAADGYPIQVDVVGATGKIPSSDTWVEVVGRYEPGVADDVPRLRDSSVTPIPQPAEPYE